MNVLVLCFMFYAGIQTILVKESGQNIIKLMIKIHMVIKD